MNQVIVIQTGYSNGNCADCSISLINTPDAGIILVDTGSPHKSHQLKGSLKQFNINVEDIGIVVGTHGHVDHIGNLSLFPNAKFFVGYDICKNGIYEDFDFQKTKIYTVSASIDVIATPGHTCSDISLIVRNTELGTIAIAGDLFENEHDRKNADDWISKSFNPELQRKNREEMLQSVDYIIPGHGKMFKTADTRQ